MPLLLTSKNNSTNTLIMIQTVRYILGTFFLAWLIQGCSSAPMVTEGRSFFPDEHVYLKNYMLNAPGKANVGEPVIKVQDFWLSVSEDPVARPNISTEAKSGMLSTFIRAGYDHPVLGGTVIDGVPYKVIGTFLAPVGPASVNWAVLMDLNGNLNKNVIGHAFNGGSFAISAYKPWFANPNVVFEQSIAKKVKSNKGYVNYEIVYNGKNASGMNFTYREFSPDGLARVAFYQNLIYENDAKVISFKNIQIEISRSSSTDIEFKVLKD